jgi:hypothetical protein
MKKRLLKALACGAIIAGAIALTGCVSSTTAGGTHWWAGLSTNGIGYAERTTGIATNGVPWTNYYSFKVTVPFNISGAIMTMFESSF